ncbi:predicted protein [Botrytis cinerea T4]|uniref:Uncharacterized protein n=1 Tax=Botryotinia fuckeliana (strain T4) TaxID=999810 RepID=G2Y6F7_BOTF4|nr:predicted protein [Botrytis cinerea T4]
MTSKRTKDDSLLALHFEPSCIPYASFKKVISPLLGARGNTPQTAYQKRRMII